MELQPRSVHNSLLFKFLLAATAVFIVVVGVLYFQQLNTSVPKDVNSTTPMKFSSQLSTSQVIREYAYGASIIHDIESYQSIRDRFFTESFNLSAADLERELLVVADEYKKRDEFARLHVYSTSYYIGNLLVLPEVTLHEMLLSEPRPQTTLLIETALADIRAGVVNLQVYFDQAGPRQYDSTYAGSLYYTSPTFPSLSMSEVGIVLFLLAKLDPQNSAKYETQLHLYANQLFTSGAHFQRDIQYALQLVEEYYKIIGENASYAPLLAEAKKEWQNQAPNLDPVPLVEPQFIIKTFESGPKLAPIYNQNSYLPKYPDEELTGSLMFSLVDTRLPDTNSRLYQYSYTEGTILPYAVNLTRRQYPELDFMQSDGSYLDREDYLFLTGRPETKVAEDSPARIVYRNQDTVTTVVGTEGDEIIRLKPRWYSGGDRFVYIEKSAKTESGELSGELFQYLVRSKKIEQLTTDASYPHYYKNRDYVLFLRGNKVMAVNANTKEEFELFSVAEYLTGSTQGKTTLSYRVDTNTVIISAHNIALASGMPESVIGVYQLGEETVPAVATKTVLKLANYAVASGVQSPGGRYLALAGTETMSRRNPKVLIFDLTSGIISTEIPLTPFSVRKLQIDDWTLFN